jgi:branched-chain amino acid transport system permease protein
MTDLAHTRQDGPKPGPSPAGDGAAARLRRLARVKGLALLAAFVVALAWPYLVSSFYVSMGTQALFFGLFALSINLLAGYGGMVTLGHAGLLGTAGYALSILTTSSGLALGPAVVVALAICIVVSACFGLLAVRTRGTYFVMITLAEGMIVWGIAVRAQSLTGGDNGITGVPRPSFATEYWQYYYLVLAVVAVCTLLIGRVVRSPFGLTLKGIRESEDRLPTLGYNVTLHKLLAFTIAGAFAGVAGMLLAMYNNFFGPTQVFLLASAEGLLMSILGGVGTMAGAFVGSAIVVFIKQYVSSYVDRWVTLLGVIFVLVILLAPDGLVGLWVRVVWRRIAGAGGSPGPADGAEDSRENRQVDRTRDDGDHEDAEGVTPSADTIGTRPP